MGLYLYSRPINQLFIRLESFDIVFQYIYVYLSYIFMGYPFYFTNRNQLHLLEQLPLSLCTYPFFFISVFLFSVYESLFVFGKPDLAQDCPFFIPGFL